MTFYNVVIDECAQGTEPTCYVPLSISRDVHHIVLVGDHQQLPATVVSQQAAMSGLNISLFERLTRLGLPTIVLEMQYRMHASISAFPNSEFYGGESII